MQITDVIALSKAGFTADQIMQMASAQVQTPAPAPQQIQQPQIPAPMQQPTVQVPQLIQQPTVQTPATQPEQPKPDPFQQLFEQMTGIKQAIQSSNIQNSQMTTTAPQTTDDILASIIQPTKPKEDK